MALILVLIMTPLMAFASAIIRATVLFWPLMVFMGAAHEWIPIIPALGWQATFLLIAVVSLLFPSGNSTVTTKK